MFGLTETMLSQVKNKRPNCEKIFKDRKSWALSLIELKSNNDLEIKIESSDKFYLRFIEMKSKSLRLIV